ncbi:hypothetical protein Avbf_06975 [Armadillidium vulgare]|nr:hypothetical protein Avbf_06975 [Armadillidium vulgare]
MPKNQQILSGDASTDMEINNGESFLRAQHRFLTHANHSYLPFWD